MTLLPSYVGSRAILFFWLKYLKPIDTYISKLLESDKQLNVFRHIRRRIKNDTKS